MLIGLIIEDNIIDVGRNLLIFSMKTKIEKVFKIILKQHRLIRSTKGKT
jgi:hypothetical protein